MDDAQDHDAKNTVDKSADTTKTKGKKGKCSYDALSPNQLKRLKRLVDPHKLKPKNHGSRYDLAYCKGSGKIVRHRKYFDPDGNPNRGSTDYDDTGYNLDDLPNAQMNNDPSDSSATTFELRLFDIDFEALSTDPPILRLPFTTWKRGDPICEGKPLKHLDSGVSIPLGAYTEWPNGELTERLKDLAANVVLRDRCKPTSVQLSVASYFNEDERPAIAFDKEQISYLSKLNASVDIDVYSLPSRASSKVDMSQRERVAFEHTKEAGPFWGSQVSLWEFASQWPEQAPGSNRVRFIASRMLVLLCTYDFEQVSIRGQDFEDLMSKAMNDPTLITRWNINSLSVDVITHKLLVVPAEVAAFIEDLGVRFLTDRYVTRNPRAEKRRAWIERLRRI